MTKPAPHVLNHLLLQRLHHDPMLREHLLIDPLRYANYVHNRQLGMSPDGAARVYGPGAAAMERRYRQEALH